MKSSDRQLLILIAGVVFILVQALAINYKIWWLTFTASGVGLLFAAFLPRAAALSTSKTNRPQAEDWVYGRYSKVETGDPDVPTTDFPLAEEDMIDGLPRGSLKARYSERITGEDPDITTSLLRPELRLHTPRPSRSLIGSSIGSSIGQIDRI